MTTRQPGRKRKRDWRKNVDLDDVEGMLEQKRLKERLGVPEEGEDEGLFFVDAKGDQHVRSALHKDQETALVGLGGMRRSAGRLLRSDEILARRSAVDPVSAKVGQTWSKGTPSLGYAKAVKRVNQAERRKLEKIIKRKNVAKNVTADGSGQTANGPMRDLWQIADGSAKSPQSTAPRKSVMDQIHPGSSYNPSFEEHQALLAKAHEQEEKRLKDLDFEKGVHGPTRGLSGREMVSKALTLEDMIIDMIDQTDQEDEAVQGPTSALQDPHPKEVERRRLKKSKARTERIAREIEAQLAKKALKEQRRGLDQIRRLVQEIEAEQRRLDEKVKAGALAKGDRGEQLRSFGRKRIEQLPVAVQVTEDLSESLRGLRNEPGMPGNTLLKEAFVHLQTRGLIEPRKRVARKDKNEKVVERHSSKRFV